MGCYFYPRSPCGERQANAVDQILPGHISIHALLAESDHSWRGAFAPRNNISIHALLAESDVLVLRKITITVDISIHALLAESDLNCSRKGLAMRYFYPRSPCGERQPAERHANSQQEFLSTLSLRRATEAAKRTTDIRPISIHALLAESDIDVNSPVFAVTSISIHALLAESDFGKINTGGRKKIFLSTLSLRRATKTV